MTFRSHLAFNSFGTGVKNSVLRLVPQLQFRADEFGSLRGSSPVKSQVGNGLAQKSFQKPSSPFLGVSRPPGLLGKVPQSLFRRIRWWVAFFPLGVAAGTWMGCTLELLDG